jgi:ferredoxin
MERMDERDTIFSRMTLSPGTERYEEYYRRRPELREIDDRLRTTGPGIFASHMPEAPMVDATFGLITQLRRFVRGWKGEYRFPHRGETEIDGAALTDYLKKTAGTYGAVLSGVTDAEERFFYGTKGRGERYGEAVEDILPAIFVFAVEMSEEEMRTAPGIREAAEVAHAYLKAAVPALVIAAYLRSLGYRATAHMDGETEVIMPPAAEAAGLGRIGRNGLLLTKKEGCRVRLAAVTTDAPLVSDPVRPFPLELVCETCNKCAELCPAGAIPSGPIRHRWDEAIRSTDHEACFAVWKKLGTDCGVCISACPYANKKSRHSAETQPGGSDFLKRFMYGG